MGVHAYTERVPLQLLDFAYRYTSGILSDALSYEPPAPHHTGGRSKAAKNDEDNGGISLNALRTAVAARAAAQFSSTLPKEFMSEVAGERNRVALPRVEKELGIRLPPERYCFTGVGFSVREAWEEEGEDEEMADGGAAGVGGGIGLGGPVGGLGGDASADGDTMMRGMEDDEDDEELFEEVMGTGPAPPAAPAAEGTQDADMTNG